MKTESIIRPNAKRAASIATLLALTAALILLFPLFPIPRPSNVSSIPWKVELLFSILLFAVAVYWPQSFSSLPKLRADQTTNVFRWLVLLLTGISAWSALSLFWATSAASAAHHILVWGSYAILFVIAYAFAIFHNATKYYFQFFSFIAIVIGGLCVFDFVMLEDFSIQEGDIRIRYAKFAEMLIIVSPLLFASAMIARGRTKKIAALVPAGLSWLAVMLSLSKGAFIAGIIGFIFLFGALILFRSDLRRKTFATASLWLILTLAVQVGFSVFSSVPSTADYISGKKDATRSTSDMRLFTWQIAARMIKSNLLLGVGADNFGIEFNDARREYAAANATDPALATGEDYLFERAHNEPLQIFAELGIPGFLFFSGAFAFIAFAFISGIYKHGNKLSPVLYASAAGIIAFGFSSLFSSFSFRAFQNGIVLFIVLAVGFRRLNRSHPKSTYERPGEALIVRVAAILIPIFLVAFSGAKAVSQYSMYIGARAKSAEEAISYFERAGRFDPDNPGAHLAIAETNAKNENWESAVLHFRKAINGGFGVSVVYSFLANAQEKNGDLDSAELTLAEAIEIFPRSTFLRARLAFVQEKLGKTQEADRQMTLARSIDKAQADGWYCVLKDGIVLAAYRAYADPSVAPPPELLPKLAIYAYTDPIWPVTPK